MHGATDEFHFWAVINGHNYMIDKVDKEMTTASSYT